MPTLELLTPHVHGKLRLLPLDTSTSHFVQIIASEFSAAAACCPILFTKDAGTGAFYAGAVLGFKPGENLLAAPQRRAGFDPLMFQREGFFVSDRSLAIDRDHERFGDRDGEPLFDESGTPAKALRSIQRAMGEISAGLQQTDVFISALTELKLIEPIDISLNFGAERLTLQGLYTVSLDRLRDVDDAVALRLFRSGHLQLIHIMAASLKQIGRLAALRV